MIIPSDWGSDLGLAAEDGAKSLSELRGYSLPLSPSGASSMLTGPPWHFSGEIVMVDYRVNAATAARFLPPGLDPGPDPGAAAAVFARWQWSSASGEELDDPCRSQFNEFLVLLGCEVQGRPMARCTYAWVDAPVPMVRGWVQGMPKQLGDVHLSQAGTVGRAAPRLAPGGRFVGTASAHGRRLAEAAVTLASVVDEAPLLHRVPLAHTLAFPGWAGQEQPRRLVLSDVTDVEFSTVWTGPADLRWHDPIDPDFASLAPVEVGQGAVFSYAETLRGGRLLRG